jgi:hypothetical protein
MPDAADIAALRRTALGYAAAVDALDGPAFADLFVDDGELWVPDPHAGFEPTIARSGRARLERIPSGLADYHVTYHAIWSAAYDVDGDRANGTVAGVAHHVAPDLGDGAVGGLDAVWYLRYADEYVRTGDAWLLSRRTLHLRNIEYRRITHVGPGRRRPRSRPATSAHTLTP